MNAQEVWSKACEILREEMYAVTFDTWIGNALVPKDLAGGCLVLECSTPYVLAMGTNRFRDQIQNAVTRAMGEPTEVFIGSPEEADKKLKELQAAAGGSVASLNPKYTFDTFVVGGSNRFAHAVSLAVAETPAKAYNPLFIYGGVGLGKTHLMHAIGHYAHELYPDLNIVYITSEDFTNQLVTAMQGNKNQQFRDRFRNADILLVDDIQFIAGKHGTEEEFFHTFNHLREAGKQIVMTSDKPPKEIQKLEERLCSRFEGGLLADVGKPDFETRYAILRKKTEYEKLNISDDILEMIAKNIETNVRELEGSLTRLVAYSGLTLRPIDENLAKEALREVFAHSQSRELTVPMIQEAVAEHFGIEVESLLGTRRNREIAGPRQYAMYLCREMLGLSLAKIGEAFGNRHHTTVLSAVERVEEDIKTMPYTSQILNDLRARIQNR